MATKKTVTAWKQIDDSSAAVTFHLTAESVLKAATIPKPPTAKAPTIVRISHDSPYGFVDADISARLGDPKRPLGVQDFDTESDWRQASLVEDLIWSDHDGAWITRNKADHAEWGDELLWCGTYDVEILFPTGQHQIEIKLISRVEPVCSIVLSNWKVNVR